MKIVISTFILISQMRRAVSQDKESLLAHLIAGKPAQFYSSLRRPNETKQAKQGRKTRDSRLETGAKRQPVSWLNKFE